MMGVPRNILLLSIVSGYLLVSCGSMGVQKPVLRACSTSLEIHSAANTASHHSEHWRISLRHSVMAKAAPTFSLGPIDPRAHHGLRQISAVWRDMPPQFVPTPHFSCLCDRAPPLS